MAEGPDGSATAPVLVVIPTYNERDNIEPLLARLHAAVPGADALIVDDGSPDGTGELADKLAANDPRVRVLHRTAKAGLGAAYLAGFAVALQGEHRVVVEMDADGSHAPEDLPTLLAALDGPDGADVVLGSRYVPGGQVVNWPAYRNWISRTGNLYSRLALGVQIRDITGGYRAFRREVLEALTLHEVESQGYCFQIDLAWRALQSGFRVVEVPITFTERERGASKMSNAIVAEALWKVTQWGVERRWRRLRRRGAPVGSRRDGPDVTKGRTTRVRPFSLDLRQSSLPRRSAPSAILGRPSQAISARRSASSSRRSLSSTSRSATERRSRSMSQCVRGGLAFFCSGGAPSTSREMLPCRRHSQVAGISASFANGTSNSCPRGQA